MSKNAFTLHYVSIESCFGFGGTHTHTHTHTHPAAETGQELETTGKGDGERGRERQQEDASFPTPGLHTLPPPLWVSTRPQVDSTPPSSTDTLTHTLTHSPSGLGVGAGSRLK